MATYIYPGSFDPVTNGHMDIIKRASGMCSKLVVAVGHNRQKSAMFTYEERLEMLSEAAAAIDVRRSIEVVGFEGLLADFAKQSGAGVIVKGLRALSDFEYEFQMALLNKHLDDTLETIFLMTDTKYTYLSSSAVKELAENGGNLNGLVPANVIHKLSERYVRG